MRGWKTLLAVALAVFAAAPARAQISEDLDFSGYADFRLVAPADKIGWLEGGLGKFRYGRNDGNVRATELIGQVTWKVQDGLKLIVVARAEPQAFHSGALDAMEAYAWYTPASDGDISWSVKAGAFYPAISLENDDLGWASSYTLTPSAINSWIGEEVRTIGSEAQLTWRSPVGALTGIFAITCCNDESGILLADRGWAMDDRPTGLTGRVRIPDASVRIFRLTPPLTTGMFDEIDGRVGWYAGLNWQIPGIGKLSVLRYDNNGDPSDKTLRGDTAWATRFWSVGARTQYGPLVLIAQGMDGMTAVTARPGVQSLTDYKSAFLLASYDLDDLGLTDFRLSAREDVFQTRRVQTTPSPMSEDGDAFTVSLSWQGYDWLRLTGEIIAMNSRKGEYTSAGFASPVQHDTQFQFSTRFFY